MTRVTESDFDELLEVQYMAFNVVPMHEALFGPNTPEQRAKIKADFIKSMHSDSSDMWMKLVDKANGRIVSAALWKIYPSWNDNEERHDGQAPWFEGEERNMAEFLMRDFMDRRVKYMWNHPHVCEFIFLLLSLSLLRTSGTPTVQQKFHKFRCISPMAFNFTSEFQGFKNQFIC